VCGFGSLFSKPDFGERGRKRLKYALKSVIMNAGNSARGNLFLAELWIRFKGLNNRGAGAQKRESETGSRNKSGA
jgi:hypothetical protein